MKTFEFILLVVAIMICGSAMASQFTTQTGQGYYTWNGQVISYYGFNPGTTINLANGVTATDTNGTPNEAVDRNVFGNFSCEQSPQNPGC